MERRKFTREFKVEAVKLIRMLLVGYCLGIRSERRLCEEVHLNLAYRWFCRLGLDGEVPDHSTFSKNRHGRFRDSDLLRQLFETVLRRCMAEGLVGGEGFAVDASLIKADANRQKGVEGSKGLPRRDDEPGHRRVSRRAGRRRVWRGDRGYAKVHLACRSGGALDRRPWRPAFFAYSTNYLIDLDHARHRRRRSLDRHTPGRGDSGQDHDRAVSTIGSVSIPSAWPPTPPMARPRCWTGWSTSAGSSRISQCSTNPSAPTAPSRAATSPMTMKPTSISAPAARRCVPRTSAPRWRDDGQHAPAIGPASSTATPAR